MVDPRGRSRRPPITDQNFFNLGGFSENILNILGQRPHLRGWRLLRQVLDPPLNYCLLKMKIYLSICQVPDYLKEYSQEDSSFEEPVALECDC